MSTEKDNIKKLDHNSTIPSVEIRKHPEEILELDEETVAVARAKLAGLEFDEMYDQEDRVSREFIVRQQAEKIRELFQSPEDLKNAFSTPERFEQAKKDMAIDGIDLEFVRGYCIRNHINFDDDAAALLNVGFGQSEASNV